MCTLMQQRNTHSSILSVFKDNVGWDLNSAAHVDVKHQTCQSPVVEYGVMRHAMQMCRDVSELLQVQIELYRVTKQNILQGLPEGAFTQMTPQARERALLQEMKSEGTLHPALYPHDKGPYTGHYKVTASFIF